MRTSVWEKKFAAAIAIGLLVLLAGCGEKVKPGTAEVKRERVTGITTEAIAPSQVNEYFETSGTVAAKTTSAVAGRMMGTVTSVKVKEGDRVRAGQLLLTIDDSDVAQKVKAAREGCNEAEKGLEAARESRDLMAVTYQRYKKLFDDKALSGQELDQIDTQNKVADIDFERAQAAVARARAGLKEAEVYHGFTRITSPVSGVVTEKKTDLGSMAVPGVPLFTIEDDSAYRIDVSGDESLSGKIKAGMDASVLIEALNREVKGKISEVVPSVDPMSRSFLVKIALKGEGLRNGFYAKVSIPIGKREALLVPQNAVVEKGQLIGVYTVDKDSVITYRLVKTGRTYGNNVEILSGLNPGENVVVGGVERAVDGGLAVTDKSERVNGEK
jgi:membrane fusion protein, multidrug efflux system